jgi:hypothetical protein
VTAFDFLFRQRAHVSSVYSRLHPVNTIHAIASLESASRFGSWGIGFRFPSSESFFQLPEKFP